MQTQPHIDTWYAATYIILYFFRYSITSVTMFYKTRHIATRSIYSINFALYLQCKSYRKSLYTYFNKLEFWN